MAGPYRIKPPVTSNVYPDVRVSGMFQISATNGSLGTIVRPSAGSKASPGVGDMFTITQPTSGTFLWLVTLAEQYYAPVWTAANMQLVPTAANAGTPGVPPATSPSGHVVDTGGFPVSIDSTMVDTTISTGGTTSSNTFFIYVFDSTTGAIPTAALTIPSGYNLQISFEVCSKMSVSPNTL